VRRIGKRRAFVSAAGFSSHEVNLVDLNQQRNRASIVARLGVAIVAVRTLA
jgi:hypothetical protein